MEFKTTADDNAYLASYLRHCAQIQFHSWTLDTFKTSSPFAPIKNRHNKHPRQPGRSRRTRKSEKKPIDQYDRKESKRTNNPPVGLVTPR